jgi:hypothetical protein
MCFVIALYCGGRVLYSLRRGVSKVYVTELFFFFLLFFSYQHCTPLNFFLAILKCRKVNTYRTCGKNALLWTDYENDFSRLNIHRYWPFHCEFTVILYHWYYLWIYFETERFFSGLFVESDVFDSDFDGFTWDFLHLYLLLLFYCHFFFFWFGEPF